MWIPGGSDVLWNYYLYEFVVIIKRAVPAEKALLSISFIAVYLTWSANSAPALNLTDLRAAISIGCFVFGLTPLRAAFSATEKDPKPKRATLPPAFNS